MAQYIYLIAAMLLMIVVSSTFARSSTQTQTRQTVNEVETLVTSVGNEMLDQIGRSWFDKFMYTNWNNAANLCGRPDNSETNRLATYGAFVTTGLNRRKWIEGYHGLDTTLTRGGFDYDVRVRIRYVPTDVPKATEADTLASQSFAKEAVLDVANPFFTVGGQPLKLRMSRTYAYSCPTGMNQVPRPPPGGSCPPVPCARP